MSSGNPDFSQADFSLTAVINPGVGITSQKGKDAVVAFTGVGIYTLTLGSGGLDSASAGVDVDFDAANNAPRMAPNVHWASPTSLVIRTFDNTNAAADVVRLSVRVRRLFVG